MTTLLLKYLSLQIVFLLALSFPVPEILAATPYEECLLRSFAEGDDSRTLGEIKATCRAEKISPAAEEENILPSTYAETFSVSPHKQNYILLFGHNTAPNLTPYDDPDVVVDHDEITFQVSLKFPIVDFEIGGKKTYLMAAYTARSFWQAYNKTLSSPFRETNHEPEVFVRYPLNTDIPGIKKMFLMAGFVHQSNGRSQPLSRSWNRLYLDLVVEGENYKLSIKPWYRLPEEDKKYIGASEGDDNPDINDYLGYGEISGAYKAWNHTFSFMLRNNLSSHENKGALELGWSFPMPFIETDEAKGYIQYFNGYGESLIDYNAAVERIGVGVILADWF